MEACRASLGVCLLLLLATSSFSLVSADKPGWFPGPTFNVTSDSKAVSTFVGQVTPSGNNQLKGIVNFSNMATPVEAQSKTVKAITFSYGPDDQADPILLGFYGPGDATYVQDPILEGGLADGLNVQLKPKAGYHFVSISFGVAMNTGGTFTDAFFVDGLGSSTVGSGSITIASLPMFSEGKFVATNIYAAQITIVPNNNIPAQRFAIDNIHYVLEQD